MSASPILIAGGGIGGLCLAVALRRAGVPALVFERATELRPVGAGITVQSNAMLALRTLGLDDAVRAAGAVPRAAVIGDPRGRVLSTLDMVAVGAELGAPSVAIHRGALHDVLRGALAGDVLRLGATAAGYRDDGDAVALRLDDGREVNGAAIVGADGLRSAIRAQLLGDPPPRYAGYTSWRGVTAAGVAADDAPAGERWGRGLRFGYTPIGGGRVYWFAVADAPPGGTDDDPLAAVRARFATWAEPVPRYLEATAAADVVRTDIHDRPPIDRWGAGRVTLLGDAAHPMTPNLGQGGCQAIEDAVVLARSLAEGGADVAAALRCYERTRQPRANAMVRTAWRLGQVAQADGAVTSWLRDLAVRATPARAAHRRVVAALRDGFTVEPATG